MVVRTRALNRRRERERRADRECAAVRPEPPEGPEALARRGELLRSVVAAVLALDEPYRQVVLLRYFEDLAPREIAARLRVPLPTVESRLRRALPILRARLEREAGPEARVLWLPALLALAEGTRGASPSHVPWALLSVGGALVSAKLAGGAAAAAALALLVLWCSGGSREPAPAVALPGDPAPVTDEIRLASAAQAGAARASAPVEATDPPLPGPMDTAADDPPPARPLLDVLVLDGDDRPVAGAEVLGAPPMQALARLGATDAEGRLRVDWRGTWPAELVLTARGNGMETGLQRVACLPGAPAQIVLRPEAGSTFRVGYDVVLSTFLIGSRVSGGPMGAEGRLIEDRWLEDPLLFPSASEARIGPGVVVWPRETRVEVVYGESAIVILETASARTAPPAAELRVELTSGGQPAEGALVWLVGQDGGEIAARRSDAEGRCLFEELPPGEVEVRAGGGEHGEARARLSLRDDAVRILTLDLDRGIELAGVLVDGSGKPLAGASVECLGWRAGAPWSRRVTTWPDGRFAVPCTPPGPLRLLVREHGADDWCAVPGDLLAPLAPDTTLRSPAAAPGVRVRVELEDSGGELLEHAEVRLWREDSGRGRWLEVRRDEESGTFALADVRPGLHRIEVGHAGRAWSQRILRVPAGAGEVRERIALEAPGILELDVEPGATPARRKLRIVCLDRPMESVSRPWTVPAPGEDEPPEQEELHMDLPGQLELPAGHYALREETPAGPRAHAFALAPGGRTRIVLPALGDTDRR